MRRHVDKGKNDPGAQRGGRAVRARPARGRLPLHLRQLLGEEVHGGDPEDSGAIDRSRAGRGGGACFLAPRACAESLGGATALQRDGAGDGDG
eukprot:4170245-Pyramimonas_sp.AAC.1